MNSTREEAGDWRSRISHELIEYGFNVVYLTLVFASFFIYRRLVLASYYIAYTNYGVAVIEAMILGKVIMIGNVFHFGRWLEKKPLIIPTFYKTVAFTLLVAAFKVIEHTIAGLWHGGGITTGLAELAAGGPHEFIANSVVVFVAFFPFFALKELGRVLGRHRIWALFFGSRADAATCPQGMP